MMLVDEKKFVILKYTNYQSLPLVSFFNVLLKAPFSTARSWVSSISFVDLPYTFRSVTSVLTEFYFYLFCF